MSRDWRVAVFVCFALFSFFTFTRTQASPAEQAEPEYCPPIDLPAEPSAAVPTLVEASDNHIDRRLKVLAGELATMWTRNPEELVAVIDEASRNATTSPSVTLLLAIAHAETNGKILDVSEAGAVGLAQATPVAVRQEKLAGRIFVTSDYLIGARAYIMKKPLGDADTIASLVVDKDDPKTRKKAKRLLKAAMDLRREGMDELDLLSLYASKKYYTAIKEADARNLRSLRRLQRLLDNGSRREVRAFRDSARKEYRELKRKQVDAWKRYQMELIAKRDDMLTTHFAMPAEVVKVTRPYEAAEYLAGALDMRFSAKTMAAFLVRHLDRKSLEARRLASKRGDVEEMTAALYNGGSHNVKRMLVGLIRTLPETQRYMKKVPATRRRLDLAMASVVTDGVQVR
ncbi:MAG: hypothetical protein JJE51_12790 [Thermoanaerobaculia bacterium]|nr:hypothetical protein [Thermoanaerobaculia bacterium]